MTIKHLFPDTWPTLNLDFANQLALDPRITFTRSSIGTYVDKNGIIQTAQDDEARFDHDPETGESLGLLIEESRTNLLTYSEEMDQSVYIKESTGTGSDPVVTPNAAVAPDGQTTADRIQFSNNGATSSGDFSQIRTAVQTTVGFHTFSFYVRSFDGTSSYEMTFRDGDGAANHVIVTGQWKRITKASPNYSAGVTNLGIGLRGGTFNDSDSADILFWGLQLETGSFQTSYLPTAGTAATRAADIASITGTNFSSWYRNSSSTFTLKGRFISRAITAATWGTLSVSTEGFHPDNNYRMRIGGDTGTQFAAKRFDNGVSYAFALPGSATAGSIYNYAVGYDDTGHAASSPLGFRSTTYPDLPFQGATILKFVPDAYSASHTISRLAYYPRRLSDEQLQALTA